MVEDVLIEKLSLSNVCTLANLASLTNSYNLKEYCVCFIIDAVKESKALPNISKLRNHIKAEIFERMSIASSDALF